MLEKREIKISPRVSLVLDPNDSATPAIVEAKHGRTTVTSTYDCASEMGTVGIEDEVVLTPAENDALARHEGLVQQYFEAARPDAPAPTPKG